MEKKNNNELEKNGTYSGRIRVVNKMAPID